MVDMFRWSLREIDETDMESLIPFMFRYPKWKAGRQENSKTAYADEVEL
jgi:hypothetical protein